MTYRDLTGWTAALTAVSVLCLGLHVIRAGLTAIDVDGASPVGPSIDIALKCAFLASAGVGLAWLYRASRNAHALSPGMKHSPAAAVAWFFAPAVNILFMLSVVYEIWTRSGGPRRAKILIVWWGLTAPAIYLGAIWLAGDRTELVAQVLFGGSTLSFLVLARRVDGFQSFAAVAAEFHEAPGPGPVDLAPEVQAAVAPRDLVETVEPPAKTASAPPGPLVGGPLGLGAPGAIVVTRRPGGGSPAES